MTTEENVYAEEVGTEDIATAKESAESVGRTAMREESASAVPQKFKDVDALARAYNALQAEFTRRSQRLKELEKTVENFREKERADSGAEKLRKNAQARKAAAKEFEEFISEVDKAHAVGKPDGLEENFNEDKYEANQEVKQTEHGEKTGAETEEETRGGLAQESESIDVAAEPAEVRAEEKGENTLLPVAESGSAPTLPSASASSEELYRLVGQNEGVRLRIIGEYLHSVGRSAPPLTTGKAGTLASPPLRARNIADAGSMALQYFKKPF